MISFHTKKKEWNGNFKNSGKCSFANAYGRDGSLALLQRNPFTCRRASPAAKAQVIATLSDRMPGRMGMRRRMSAASCTMRGTPADFTAEQQNVARFKSMIQEA